MPNCDTERTSPQVIESATDIRRHVEDARIAGRTVGLVPTMGALHEGHLSLIRAARAAHDVLAVTLFVNPEQFGPHEDLADYPRTLDADMQAMSECGVDVVFAPTVDEVYPPGFSTYIEPPRVAERFEGECRPGHFRGVATVVAKLFNLVPADVAYFGQKDYQQTLVVRQMVADLNLPIEVNVCPTVRELDGLALSSRNKYLSGEEREQAVALSQALRRALELYRGGEHDTQRLEHAMESLLYEAGIEQIDYAAIADATTLKPLRSLHDSAVALVAAYVGSTRLIDNQFLSAADA